MIGFRLFGNKFRYFQVCALLSMFVSLCAVLGSDSFYFDRNKILSKYNKIRHNKTQIRGFNDIINLKKKR